MPREDKEDDSITIETTDKGSDKTASEPIVMFDKTSYKDAEIKDPLEISPDRHRE